MKKKGSIKFRYHANNGEITVQRQVKGMSGKRQYSQLELLDSFIVEGKDGLLSARPQATHHDIQTALMMIINPDGGNE